MAVVEHAKCARKPMVAVAAAALSLSLAACGPETSGQIAGVDDVAQAKLFANNQSLNETVTIDAEVADVLTPTSFELHAPELGDETLLVVSCIEKEDITEDDTVTVTGTVREFLYDEFATDYKLAEDKALYEPYESEQFLVADDISKHG